MLVCMLSPRDEEYMIDCYRYIYHSRDFESRMLYEPLMYHRIVKFRAWQEGERSIVTPYRIRRWNIPVSKYVEYKVFR